MPGSLAELAEHDLIGFDHETPVRRRFVQHFPMLRRPEFALRSDSDLAQLAAIRAGFGIGICQVQVAQRDPELVRILGQVLAIDLGLWIVMHEDLRTSARCRAVFDALVDGLQSGPDSADAHPEDRGA